MKTQPGNPVSQDTPLLPAINSPADLRQLSPEQLPALCGEIRKYLIDVVTEVGGHFASSLGAVELTVALHYVYDTPRDKLVWDIGHQSYIHKILTGRREQLRTIRQYNGISGFLRRDESVYDTFGAGHSATSISAALGMAMARDLKHESHEVVAVIGDGGITGGLAFEGLNNAGASQSNITVILNDNRLSISKNVGALSRYLAEILTDPLYNKIKGEIWTAMGKAPFSTSLRGFSRRLEESLKNLVVAGMFFEDLGFKYIGPIDGHNLEDMLNILGRAKEIKKPLLLHVVTQKGRGFQPAEADPIKWYAIKGKPKSKPVEASEPAKAPEMPAYLEVFGKTAIELAERDPRVVAVTAAMCIGTGLVPFSERYPQRFFDVSIAEGHAVTFSAGLAAEGFRPLCAIYSTFLQRAFDSVVHDVSLQDLPVIFAIDRAGLVGEDGPTHHGNLDLAFLSCIPGMVVTAPKDGNELRNLLFTALAYDQGPFAIRYPKAPCWNYDPAAKFSPIPIGQWEILRPGSDACILAVGTMVQPAREVAERLAEAGYQLEVVNARYVKPLDVTLLDQVTAQHRLIVTMEEANRRGGFGQAVSQFVQDEYGARTLVRTLAIADTLVPHGARPTILDWAGLSVPRMTDSIRGMIESLSRERIAKTPRTQRLTGTQDASPRQMMLGSE
ncbi:MAG: 1-deoxy-D-xylulose-5-phosphate synthase [Candidatus Zixiibacteriota bacterium]